MGVLGIEINMVQERDGLASHAWKQESEPFLTHLVAAAYAA